MEDKKIKRLEEKVRRLEHCLQEERDFSEQMKYRFNQIVQSRKRGHEDFWYVDYLQESKAELERQYERLQSHVEITRKFYAKFDRFYFDFIEKIGVDKFKKLSKDDVEFV